MTIVKPDNPFRDWLVRRVFDSQWVPIAQNVEFGALSRPVLVRVPESYQILDKIRDVPFYLDDAGPDVTTKFIDGEEHYETSIHPVSFEDGLEYRPIVVQYSPSGRQSWIEPIQAFVLYWNAWPDFEDDGRIIWRRQVNSGELEDIARWNPQFNERKLEILRHCLLAFLSMFNYDLLIFYTDLVKNIPGLLHGWHDAANEDDRLWEVFTVETGSRTIITTINSTCLIRQPDFSSTCQPWQREEKSGIEYIVGTNTATGKPETKTFEQEQDYLTPVFFRDTVLEKYYADSSLYEVEEYIVRCKGQWYLHIARTSRKTIHAWLGDVALLPLAVQKHWQQYSVADDGGVPSWRIRSDLLAEHIDAPRSSIFGRLNYVIQTANSAAETRYGLPLYRSFDLLHEQRIKALRTPANHSIQAFQEQLGTLVILVVEHINIGLLDIAGIKKNENEGTLKRLASFVSILLSIEYKEARSQIYGLFVVQELRSKLVAHRTGKEAYRALDLAGITLQRLPEGFEKLVERVCAAINAITLALETGQE